jgi:Flp pilus assembly protein TadG
MMEQIHLGQRRIALPHRVRVDERAAQIVEFAVSLPLLLVFVVGIFDFSGAFTLKQKLTNIAREGARAAAAEPANDLGDTSTVPASVDSAFKVVDNYLVAENINDCKLSPTPIASGLTWTYTGSGSGCPTGGLTLKINRGYVFPATGGTSPVGCQPTSGGTVNVVGTCVSITYAYKWRFNSVITLLVPGATYAGVSHLTTSAVAFNEN